MSAHTVPDEADGRRADVVLAGLLDVSRSRAAGIIDDGRALVGARVLRRSDRLRGGDRVEVVPAEPDSPIPPPALPPVRWQDEHLLVVAKPPGLVVHPGHGHPAGTLVDALRAAGVPLAGRGGPERPGIVHRLDRDTSGLMLVACSDVAFDGLVEALRRRDVARRYLALAQGTLPAESGRVDAPIGRDPHDRQRFAAIEDGRPAVTHWHVRATGDAGGTPVSLLECRLQTGRTHQIRVHLAFAGAPVVGDARYGASASVAGRVGLDRPFLHAARLGFTHPVTGETIELAEPLPDDLRAPAASIGLPAAALTP